MPTTTKTGAITAGRFTLLIDGAEFASFSELGGITCEVQAAEYVEGGTKQMIARMFGRTVPPRVLLKRGKSRSVELWAWHEAVRRGDESARRTCDLVMYGVDGEPVAHYHLEHAWPSKLEVGAAKAGASVSLTETVELLCENLQRVSLE
jgi:phage tail-like protein